MNLMKEHSRSHEAKSYLVLQHLYEIYTDKDPTGMDPYKMEQGIISAIDHIAESVTKDLLRRLDEEYKDGTATSEDYERLMRVFTGMKSN